MYDPLSEASKGSSFLKNVSTAREERQVKRDQNQAIQLLQSHVRFALAKRHARKKAFDYLNDNVFVSIDVTAKCVLCGIKKALCILKLPQDMEILVSLIKSLLRSLDSRSLTSNIVSLSLHKTTLSEMLEYFDALLDCVSNACEQLNVASHLQRKTFSIFTNFVIVLCNYDKWGVYAIAPPPLRIVLSQLSRSFQHLVSEKQIAMKLLHSVKAFSVFAESTVDSAALTSVSLIFKGTMKIVLEQYEYLATQKDDSRQRKIAMEFLCVGGISVLVERYGSEFLPLILADNGMFSSFVEILSKESSSLLQNFTAEKNLYMIGNYIHFNSIHLKMIAEKPLTFLTQLHHLLLCLEKLLHDHGKKSTHREWHQLFGLVSSRVSCKIDCVTSVLTQIRHLWSVRLVKALLGDLLDLNRSKQTSSSLDAAENLKSEKKKMTMKRFFAWSKMNLSGKSENGAVDFSDPVAVQASFACSVYQLAVLVFPQIKTEILAALSYQNLFIPNIWAMMCELGSDCGYKVFMEHLKSLDASRGISSDGTLNGTTTAIDLLALFCESTANYIVILDEKELYDDQKVLSLDNLCKMGMLMNKLLYRCLVDQLLDPSNSSHALITVFKSMLTLLRDHRRSFTPKGHWLLKDVKLSQLLSDIEKEKKYALAVLHFIPHVVPFTDRVQLFRSFVDKERGALGLLRRDMSDDEGVMPPSPPAHLITVRRNRIVDDGFNQLAELPGIVLKRVIRVRFVNEQNLPEAGIDQDGVFKEFIEELTRRIFDPTVGLFATTADNKLYPSFASQIVPNHLQLFEFIGKVLAKALYERILVDVPFASFFLSQLMGHRHSSSASFSFFDDLPSFDEQLYRSLTYVKHYDGNVEDLELTFSFDKSMLGRTVTFEIVPGGSAIRVTNENRIVYLHMLANYQMFTMIREQTAAFLRGFRQIIRQEWLHMFDVGELQMLISGDASDIDVTDLRRNVIYYGGFHDQHQVIKWLWDILEKDFNPVERKLFLKFVTSCSKPPLLGFAALDPPFSIRCVEVADDQDTGDTVGSVIKGFLHIGRSKSVIRLPTASTCFNLLKLPNYPKRSVLKEKLRYAINSKAGFELS